MACFFIPYDGSLPASVDINGHRLLVVSPDRIDLEKSLELFGADRVASIGVLRSETEVHEALEALAEQINGDVVIAPDDSELLELLSDLSCELPWLH